MEPTLSDLAQRHAAGHVPKKKRNADLRRWGFDPDGTDGEKYRRLLHAAIYGGAVAGIVDEEVDAMQAVPQCVYLWDVPREEHAAWLAAGLGDCPWEEYQGRLAAVESALKDSGQAVRTVRLSVAEVLSAMRELGEKNTPEGRAAAIGYAAMKRKD